MAMPKPRYTTPEEWQEMVNSPSWQEYKRKMLATGRVVYGPGL